jgi:hypothetical protein
MWSKRKRISKGGSPSTLGTSYTFRSSSLGVNTAKPEVMTLKLVLYANGRLANGLNLGIEGSGAPIPSALQKGM